LSGQRTFIQPRQRLHLSLHRHSQQKPRNWLELALAPTSESVGEY
jgi:hypothetical protein